MAVPNFKRTPVPSGDTPGNVMFDGKRMRKAVHRKTLDYNSSVLQFLNNRIWQRDQRDFRAIQPDALYQLDLVPPTSMLDNPMNCVTTKFIRTSTNKFRCPIFCLAWTPEGRRLVTGASSGEFTLWNGLTFNFETILQAHDASVRSMVWSHNNTWMVTGDHSGFIKYWQTNMNNVKMYQGHKEPVRGISFCPTDSKFSTCSDDGTIRIWDFLRCHEEKILRGHGADVKCVDWHPQKSLLASGSKDNQQPIKLWDPKSGTSLATIHGHKATVMELKWNKNGNWLLTASRDHLIKLFDIRNMKEEMQTFKGHKKEATSISWHPVHEGLFVSGGFDGAIMFWMVGTDRELGAMEEAHEGMVWSLAWHPLGHILASGSNDHTTKFWTRNRPGDRMRDRYNLNTLPGGSEHELPEFDLDNVYTSVIPGMGIADKNEKTETNNNSSKVEVEHEEPAIPGLDWGADEEFLRQQDRHQPKKKIPYARPIPRNFEEAWTTNKQPKDFRNEEAREEDEQPSRKGRDRRGREDKRRGDRDREINGDSRDMRKRNRRGKRHEDYEDDDDGMMQQDGPQRFQDQGMPPDQRMRGGGNQGPGGPMRHPGPGMQGPMDPNMGPGNPNSLLGQGPPGIRMQGPGMNQQPRPLMFNDGMQGQRMGNPQQGGGMMSQQGGMGPSQFGGPRPLMQQGGMGPPQQQRFMGPGQQQQQQGMMGPQQGMVGQQQGMMGQQQGMMGGPQQGMMGPPRMQGPGQQQGGPPMGPSGMSQGQNPRMRGLQDGGQFQGQSSMDVDQNWNQGPNERGNKENQENDFRNDRDFRHSSRKDEFNIDRDDRGRSHSDWGGDERSRGKGDRGPGRGGMQDQQQGFRNSQNDRFRNNDQDNRFSDNDNRFNQNDQIEMMDYDERSDSRRGGGSGQSSDFNRNIQGGRGPDRSQRGGFRSGGGAGGQRGNDDRNRQGDQQMEDFNRQGQFDKGFNSGGNQMQFQNQQGGYRDSNYGGMEMHQGGWGDRQPQQQQQRGSPGRGGQRNRPRGDMGGRGGGGGGRGGGFRGGGQRSGR